MSDVNAAPGPTVLVVDDDPLYLRALVRLLRGVPIQLLTACGSEAALAIGAEHAGKIDLLLTDVILPHIDGPALAARLREQHPKLEVIFMSGYGIEVLAEQGVDAIDEDHFLNKPVPGELLRARVAQVLQAGRA